MPIHRIDSAPSTSDGCHRDDDEDDNAVLPVVSSQMGHQRFPVSADFLSDATRVPLASTEIDCSETFAAG